MQQAELIQCTYNTIYYLAAILFLAAIFNFTTILIQYVIFGVFYGMEFMKW